MKKIKLTQGKYALVDDCDYEMLSQYNWHVKRFQYVLYAARQSRIGGKQTTLRMHRLLVNAPKGMEVDHIDGDGLNNQRSNLRIVTHSQNQMNKPKQSRNTSGFKGVYWDKTHKKWKAYITSDGVQKNLGSFKSREDAHQARSQASIAYHKEFAHVELLTE